VACGSELAVKVDHTRLTVVADPWYNGAQP